MVSTTEILIKNHSLHDETYRKNEFVSKGVDRHKELITAMGNFVNCLSRPTKCQIPKYAFTENGVKVIK